jgi:hypothetical protein
MLKFFDSDPGRDLFDPGSEMEKFESGMNIPDLQHCDVFRVSGSTVIFLEF